MTIKYLILLILLLVCYYSLANSNNAKSSSTNNGLNGLLLGKDRELFHVAIDLKWFFSKLTDFKGWGKMVLNISKFSGSVINKLNIVSHNRKKNKEKDSEELYNAIEILSAIKAYNPYASIQFFGGTSLQALDYSNKQGKYLIVYVEDGKNEHKNRNIIHDLQQYDSIHSNINKNKDNKKHFNDIGSINIHDDHHGNYHDHDYIHYDSTMSDTNNHYDIHDVTSSASPIVAVSSRRALGDYSLGTYINSKFVMFGGQSSCCNTIHLMKKLGIKSKSLKDNSFSYPYFSVVYVHRRGIFGKLVPEVLGTLKVSPDIKADKINRFLIRAQEVHATKKAMLETSQATKRSRQKGNIINSSQGDKNWNKSSSDKNNRTKSLSLSLPSGSSMSKPKK